MAPYAAPRALGANAKRKTLGDESTNNYKRGSVLKRASWSASSGQPAPSGALPQPESAAARRWRVVIKAVSASVRFSKTDAPAPEPEPVAARKWRVAIKAVVASVRFGKPDSSVAQTEDDDDYVPSALHKTAQKI
mmetsp:Transcript_12137/g.40494  ORF Transcript_12137/g.40494 Transcript_12137/m.40494 type:complete len:135 (-) Transcript_12137:89-493(-)